MNTKLSTNRKLKRMFVNILSIVVMLVMAFPVTGSAYAQGEPIPWLIAFPENDAVEGWEWPEGATVSLSINGITDPDWSGVAHVTDWGDPRTYVRIEFWENYNLQISDEVTLTDEFGQTTTHTVQNLAVTEANGDTDTVSGTANFGAIVQVWPHGTYYFIEDTVEDGTWTADFGGLGFYEIEQTGGRSQIVIDGNATAVDWHVTYPRFTVFPEWEWFDGLDWPNGATVTITVEGKEAVCTTEGTSWNYFFNGGFPEGCDVVVGDIVTFSYGETIRTHTVQNLAITKVNQEDNIVKGTADAGAEVHVWPHATGQEQLAITTPKGIWNVDFTSIYNIMLGDGGRAEIRDEMGNATAADWYIPNPRLIAFPAMNQIFGYGWPYGSRVNLNINGKHIAGTYVQGAPWDPNDIMAYFDFGGLHDLVAGDVVTLSGRDMEINYIVQNLTVTEADADANTVSGTSDPYETVYVWQHEPGPQLPFEANENGEWLADLSGYYDIHLGSSGRSEIRDEVGNATAVDWRSPNTRFSVFPEWEYIEGWEWPDGATVYASIEGKSECFAVGTAGYTGDPITFVQMWLPEGCDAVVGEIVTLTDNVTTRQHTIQNLAVTGVNADEDTVSGTADEGAQVHVWPHGYNELLLTTDADGNWTANFTETGPDLMGGMGGRTEIRDDVGNATAVEWGVPATLVVTSTDDVLANDGFCTLREAIIAAKTNAPSGELEGECPAGSEFAVDTILLAADQTYSLTISGSDENESYTGDLDIQDNSATLDLIIMVEGDGKATVSQDAVMDDRVIENHGATVKIEGLTLTGGGEVGIGGGVANHGTLEMTSSEVSGNAVSWSGGGIFNTGSGIMVVNNTTISGNSAPNDGGGGVVNEGDLSLNNVIVAGNSASHDGGGIHNNRTLTINGGILSGNYSGGGGGALANMPNAEVMIQNGTLVQGNTAGGAAGLFNYGTLTVTDSTVTGNSGVYAGGIGNAGGQVTLSNTVVSDNTASASAGGIHNTEGGTITIENGSVVSGNTAAWDGGGINNWDGTITLSNSAVSGNSTGQGGGGIFNLSQGTVIVDATVIIGNTAGDGGGITNRGGMVTLTNSTVSENTAVWGGGVMSYGGQLTMDVSSVSDNTADNDGGGIFIKELTTANIQNGSIISDNTAAWGGGISTWNSTLMIDASTISGNSVINSGGGLLVHDGGTTTIQNGSVVSGNAAQWEGGISIWSGSTLTVDGSVISGNTASDSAGGLGSSATVVVTNSQIINNTAPWAGGIGNWGGMMTLTNSIISGNSAINDAGGIGNSGILTIETSTISGNTAGGQGGGLVNWGGTLTITGSALLANISNGEGDAVYSAADTVDATTVTNSCIVGNGITAVFNERSTSQNFTNNWWGDLSGPSGTGPGIGDSVSDNIDFAGWLNEPLSICAP